ncbi:SAM-dependent methyltransferase [Streptosporangium sp. NPDC020072]|uniref:SAM-dependent methyltransferase n=1 Tax=Streptosporangium sp. NPDC020072 TaxID=3154788 RepID=UPI00344270B2
MNLRSSEEIDSLLMTKPTSARIAAYLRGDSSHCYGPDREAANILMTTTPLLKEAERARRGFVIATARTFATVTRQLIVHGYGYPSSASPNLHHVTHAVHPGMPVAYLDDDPSVTAYLHRQFGRHRGVHTATAAMHDLSSLPALLPGDSADLLSDRPTGVILTGLELIRDLNPVLAGLRKHLVAGSRLAITHLRTDEMTFFEIGELTGIYRTAGALFTPRSSDALAAALKRAGYVLDEPGPATLHPWEAHNSRHVLGHRLLLGVTATVPHQIAA